MQGGRPNVRSGKWRAVMMKGPVSGLPSKRLAQLG
jgi:hypothetical protein